MDQRPDDALAAARLRETDEDVRPRAIDARLPRLPEREIDRAVFEWSGVSEADLDQLREANRVWMLAIEAGRADAAAVASANIERIGSRLSAWDHRLRAAAELATFAAPDFAPWATHRGEAVASADVARIESALAARPVSAPRRTPAPTTLSR